MRLMSTNNYNTWKTVFYKNVKHYCGVKIC